MARLSTIFCVALTLASLISAQNPSSGVTEQPPASFSSIRMAHAILGPLSFVVLFPIGAITIRLFRASTWIHAGWMAFTYMLVLAAMGMGVWMAYVTSALSTPHAIIGLVVVGCLLLQPVTGVIHHMLYKRSGRPNTATYPHIWWGRAIITLGIINGGLGLQLSDNTVHGEVVYGVIAGFFWCLWLAVVVFTSIRGRGMQQGEPGEKAASGSSRQSENGTRTASNFSA